MKTLSVVCARGGSKGLVNKCTRRINGKMVAQYSIEYSLSLGPDVKTVVSTDMEELADYCRKHDVPLIERRQELCADGSRIEDVLADAIEKFGEECDLCSLVYGNIPLRHRTLFDGALRILREDDSYDAAISMQNVEKHNPEWMFDLNDAVLPTKSAAHYRRQCLPQKMIHDGHTLVFRVPDFLRRYHGEMAYDADVLYSIFGTRIKPLVNTFVIIDIDTAKDLKIAEALLSATEVG